MHTGALVLESDAMGSRDDVESPTHVASTSTLYHCYTIFFFEISIVFCII
jgi:hypothetical protein